MFKGKRFSFKGNVAVEFLICLAISALIIILLSFIFAIIANALADPTANLGIFSFSSLIIGAIVAVIVALVLFGGIIGKVVSIKEETFVLETTKEKTHIRFLKGAIRSVDVRIADVTAAAEAKDAPEQPAEEAPKKFGFFKKNK
jgi:preprotein translocase subunit YajC